MHITTTLQPLKKVLKKPSRTSKDSLDYDYEVFCLIAAGNPEPHLISLKVLFR